jgi:hypothetical protein
MRKIKNDSKMILNSCRVVATNNHNKHTVAKYSEKKMQIFFLAWIKMGKIKKNLNVSSKQKNIIYKKQFLNIQHWRV